MPNLVNRLVVRELTAAFDSAEGLLLLTYGGLDAVQNETLRDMLAEKGCEVRMLRNALARLVLQQRGFELAPDVLSGNMAVAFGSAEAIVHAAKILSSPEIKKVGKVSAKTGVLDGRLLGPADLEELASVPDRTTLLAKILGCVSGPPRGIAGALNALPSGLVRVLQARAEQLEKSGAAAS